MRDIWGQRNFCEQVELVRLPNSRPAQIPDLCQSPYPIIQSPIRRYLVDIYAWKLSPSALEIGAVISWCKQQCPLTIYACHITTPIAHTLTKYTGHALST